MIFFNELGYKSLAAKIIENVEIRINSASSTWNSLTDISQAYLLETNCISLQIYIKMEDTVDFLK